MIDWKPIASAPRDGTRVRVAHSLDPSSKRNSDLFNTTGVFERGGWRCTSGFVCIDHIFRWTPDLWASLDRPKDERLVTDVCACVSCRSDCADIAPCVAEEGGNAA